MELMHLTQIAPDFPEIRGVAIENLMYVKEDLIIPQARIEHNIARKTSDNCCFQHYTFYDLIVTKARGKSGPLFHFDVHDDVRVINDSRIEKDEVSVGSLL
jgi:protein FAM50